MWIWPDPAWMFSDFYGMLRWEPWWESPAMNQTHFQPLPCCVTPKTSLVARWNDTASWSPIANISITGEYLFSIIIIGALLFCKLSWPVLQLWGQSIKLSENLLWWFKEHLKCSLVLSQSLEITSGLSDVGVKGKMEITRQGLVLCCALGMKSEFGSSGFYSFCWDFWTKKPKIFDLQRKLYCQCICLLKMWGEKAQGWP